MEKVNLTIKAVSDFLAWSNTRYNDYIGFGNKKENVNTVYESLGYGFYTKIYFKKDGTRIMSGTDVTKKIFTVECASPVGENGNGRNWKTKTGGDVYTIDCVNKSISSKYRNETIYFK